MRRRRRVKPSGGVQMFSFLDAMICTMGALLVLLHAFARHGQIEIAEKAEARSSESEIKAQREDVAWRIEHLKQSRAQTEAGLADSRLKLSHVEDHERRLREKLRELKIAADEMERLESTDAGARRQTDAELAAVKDKVRQAQQAVEEARQKAHQGSPAYSVVPYEGPHTTRRRPIYIECRADAVVLQPEGVELAAQDFAGPMGPGNPLASALRGMSEYLARQAADKGGAGEPYPLLLVRPDGIEAYYAARSALVSWGSDFGYELVGADWKLKFPEPDPGLTELTRQVVAEARQRHREYLATASQIVRSRSRPTYHARSRGGFAPNPGSGGGGSGRGGSGAGGWDSLGTNWSRRGGNGLGGPNDEGGGRLPTGTRGPGDDLAGDGGLDASGGGSAEKREASPRDQRADTRNGSQSGPGGTGQGSRESGSFDGNQGKFAADGSRRGGSGAAGSRGQQADAAEAGEPGSDRGSASARGNAKGQSAFAAGSPSAPGGSASGSTFGSPGSSGSQDASSEMDGAPPSSMGVPSQSKKVNSMARMRGRDWGLPDAGPAAIAATRPIRVECHNDRLVIVPEARNEPQREIRLGTNTQDSMDELVSNVWQHMKGWGVAGKGLYWRPTLVMDVKPGAADRYAEIKALLADSGLDVNERRPPPAAKNPARKTTR